MPVITRILSIGVRLAEIAFAAIVAGVIGSYLHDFDGSSAPPGARFIYTEVVAGISILLGLIWLIPFTSGFINWPLEFLLSAAWFAAFGLLVNAIHKYGCGSIWNWAHFDDDRTCDKFRAGEAFSFLSAILWLVSTLLGLWFVYRVRDVALDGTTSRRGWYRRHIV